MITKWDYRFLELANHISTWSKDPSTKVGCVIARPDNTIASVGYNGFPKGVDDSEDRYNDRDIKYLMVKHAEENAVYFSKEPLNGYTVYITHPPCSTCAGTLIQNGISRIVTYNPSDDFLERYRKSFKISSMMLKEANIDLVLINSVR